jgi:hypothetical protein
MVLGGINCAPANKGIEDFLREQRAIREKVIRQRLRQASLTAICPRRRTSMVS